MSIDVEEEIRISRIGHLLESQENTLDSRYCSDVSSQLYYSFKLDSISFLKLFQYDEPSISVMVTG